MNFQLWLDGNMVTSTDDEVIAEALISRWAGMSAKFLVAGTREVLNLSCDTSAWFETSLFDL